VTTTQTPLAEITSATLDLPQLARDMVQMHGVVLEYRKQDPATQALLRALGEDPEYAFAALASTWCVLFDVDPETRGLPDDPGQAGHMIVAMAERYLAGEISTTLMQPRGE